MKELILYNGWFAQIVDNQLKPFFGAVVIKGGIITEIIQTDNFENLLKSYTNFDKYNLNGKLVTVPLVNYHEHIYSKLAKGLSINSKMSNFNEILGDYWWVVDQQLDVEMVKYSALLTGIDSIKNGVGTIFDHNSSPSYIKNSLNTISEALNSLKIKNVLCYEITDRNGIDKTDEAIDESADFIKNSQNEFSKALIGLHASFTIDDTTLARISELQKSTNCGIHIHVCEDKADRTESIIKYGKAPVDRLKNYNLINQKSIIAHGVHLTADEIDYINEVGGNIAINPDSNLNNSVGVINFRLLEDIKILLGTDGMHHNMLKSLKNVFLLARYQGLSFSDTFKLINRIFVNQQEFYKTFFNKSCTINSGEFAELVVWDYVAPTDVNANNIWGHIIYGLTESCANDFIIGDQFILENKEIKIVDEKAVMMEGIKQGKKLYSQIASLG